MKLYEISIMYNETRHSCISMLLVAGQTAGPIGLKFFVDTQGCDRPKNRKFVFNFFNSFLFHGQRRAL